MPAPREYDAETQERAVRMYRDRIAEHGGSKTAARRHASIDYLSPIEYETRYREQRPTAASILEVA